MPKHRQCAAVADATGVSAPDVAPISGAVFAVPTRPESVYVPGAAAAWSAGPAGARGGDAPGSPAVGAVPAENRRYSTGGRGAAAIAVRAVGKIACSVAVPVTSVPLATGGVISSPAIPPVSAVG